MNPINRSTDFAENLYKIHPSKIVNKFRFSATLIIIKLCLNEVINGLIFPVVIIVTDLTNALPGNG
jgi:D-alanyl-lipoteichoic acid acyltransferase DltB (MBOAT superfamily)